LICRAFAPPRARQPPECAGLRLRLLLIPLDRAPPETAPCIVDRRCVGRFVGKRSVKNGNSGFHVHLRITAGAPMPGATVTTKPSGPPGLPRSGPYGVIDLFRRASVEFLGSRYMPKQLLSRLLLLRPRDACFYGGLFRDGGIWGPENPWSGRSRAIIRWRLSSEVYRRGLGALRSAPWQERRLHQSAPPGARAASIR
jgi:hypothetical protein